jgi:hypothetical protein
LIAIQRDIQSTRDEIAAAMVDLENAAKSLVTADHWKRAAHRSFAQRPGVWLAAAFGLGFWLGSRKKPARLEIS